MGCIESLRVAVKWCCHSNTLPLQSQFSGRFRHPQPHHGDTEDTEVSRRPPVSSVNLRVLCGRKNVAPASSRQTVLLTQKELSRLTCRRDAGSTILSHDLRLRGETGSLAASGHCLNRKQ